MKVTQWTSPTADSYPRRVEIGNDGMIYVGEFNGGKMIQFDPKTQVLKEIQLPGPDPSPYALGVDSDGNQTMIYAFAPVKAPEPAEVSAP